MTDIVDINVNKTVETVDINATPNVVQININSISGDVEWGEIEGILSNQTDLQNALDLKANNSDLGAVAFSNDYNDLDNLPTIPNNLEELHNVTSTNYTTPIDADSVLTYDSTNSLWKRLSWSNIKSNLKTYFDTIYQTALGFTPENVANKSTDVNLGTSNTLYPTQNAVKTYVDNQKEVLEFADLSAFPVTGETGKIYLALDTNFTYRWSGSDYVNIKGEFNTTINAKVLDTPEKVGLKIQNLLDEDFRRSLVIQGGLTANQRRYFEYLNHLGVRTNLLGFNAQNSFIAYDSVNTYHFLSCNSAGTSSINSFGTFQVRVNADEGATGNNGMAIYDGTANPATSNIMYNLSSAGIYLNKGRVLQAQSPDNLQFNKFFCTNGSAYINSTLALRLYNTGNKFNFADSGLVDRFVIDVASSKVKVGIGTATPDANSIVDVVSTTQFSRPFPVMTEAQRLAIVSPKIGGHVYQSNGTEGVYVYKSSGWVFAY